MLAMLVRCFISELNQRPC